MGKIAQPSTNYCGGFTQAALSTPSGTFTTENPPISYTLNGTTVTVSDATGVIGQADLSGKLIAESTVSAVQGVEYCDGKPKAELKWSNGSKTTVNTPISYQLLPGEDRCLLIDGVLTCFDKEISSWTANAGLIPGGEIINGNSNCRPATRPYSLSAPAGYCIIGADETGTYWSPYSNINVWRTTINAQQQIDNAIAASPNGYITSITLTFDSIYVDNRGQVCIAGTFQELVSGCRVVVVFTDNSTTELFYLSECPSIQPGPPDILLQVSDSLGVVFEGTYRDTPTDFQVTCYDYDISQVKYACEGSCPDAEFECRCEETNTLMCYGWDPDNEDLFKPLFITSITSD